MSDTASKIFKLPFQNQEWLVKLDFQHERRGRLPTQLPVIFTHVRIKLTPSLQSNLKLAEERDIDALLESINTELTDMGLTPQTDKSGKLAVSFHPHHNSAVIQYFCFSNEGENRTETLLQRKFEDKLGADEITPGDANEILSLFIPSTSARVLLIKDAFPGYSGYTPQR